MILDALEFGSDQIKYLLHHFLNVEIKDAKAFQRNAPKTEDFYNIVERSRPDIHRVLDDRLKNNQWPFQFDGKWNQEENEYKTDKETGKQYITNTKYRTKQCFSGMVVASDLYESLIQDPILKKEYITRDLILDWCTENHIPWPNGKPTKQIMLPINTYPRAHLIRDYEVNDEKLSTMTEGQLGSHYYFHTFDTIEHANNSVQYSRNENKQRSPNYKPKQTNFNY